MSSLLHLRVPKEHGAWAMLYVPFALGVLVAGRLTWAVVWVLLAATALLFGRESLRRLVRARRRGQADSRSRRALAVELCLLGVAAALLLFRERLFALVPLGVAAAALLVFNLERAERREERGLASELVAVAGLALAAPAAHYAALRTWQPQAIALWGLCCLYFGSSVFHVKAQLLAVQPQWRGRYLWMRRASVAYHAGLLLLLAWLIGAAGLRSWAAVAFLPLFARTVWSLARPPERLDLKRTGVLEIAYSLHYLVFAWLALRQP